MDELPILFPSVVLQLEKTLDNNIDLVGQIRSARVTRVSFDPDANSGYIYVHSGRDLNVIEQNIIGIKHGRTVQVPGEIWMYIDVDNLERLMGIEILDASPELAQPLTLLSKRSP